MAACAASMISVSASAGMARTAIPKSVPAPAPSAAESGPAGSVMRSREIFAPTPVMEVLTENASPVKLAAWICETIAGVFAAKKFTVPLFSNGRILVRIG